MSSRFAPSGESKEDRDAAEAGTPAVANIAEGEAIAKQLKDIPVYTVTSNENFVLLQDESKDSATSSSMLMLFMSANDAVSFKDEVFGTQNLSKPKIGTLFMDKVFRLHMQARPKELENVALRLMPDRKQVQHAFSSCKEMGSPISVLPGVPVFQAEGLTMRSGNKTFVPLFFGKEELDFALEQAFGKNLVTPAVAYKREWMDRQKQRIKEVAKSPFPFLYHNIWAKDDEKAKARIKELESKQSGLIQKRAKPVLPKVEVGCFEDVLFRMLYDKGKEWENVLFIPQGVSFK